MTQLPRSSFAIAAFLIGVAASRADADLLAPGEHSVDHRIVFELAPTAAGYNFYIFPARMDTNTVQIVAGQPLPSMYRPFDPHVYAVKSGTVVDNSYFSRTKAPRSDLALRLVRSLPNKDRTRQLTTRYRIERVDGDKVIVKLVSEERFDESGKKIGAATRIDFGDYGRMLALTVGVEVLVALALFGVRGDRWRLTWNVALVNLATHPAAFVARVLFGAPFAIVEAVVVLVEAAGLRAAGRPLQRAAAIALAANGVTAALSFVVR